jgi:hypothetical protein
VYPSGSVAVRDGVGALRRMRVVVAGTGSGRLWIRAPEMSGRLDWEAASMAERRDRAYLLGLVAVLSLAC